jgi:ELWxxDGT repeat protein
MEDRTVPAQAVAVGPDLTLAGLGPNTGTHVGNSLYFLAHQSTDAPGVSEIWQVGGTATATELNVPALAGMSINEIANIGNTLYVTAWRPTNPMPMDPSPAVNLWKIDSTAPGGAVELTNFNGAGAADLEAVGNKLVFEQSTFTSGIPSNAGNSLWVSDGTAAGTMQLQAFTGQQFANLGDSATAGGYLYFTVDSYLPGASSVWVTDATIAGTRPVSQMTGIAPNDSSFSMTAAGNVVYIAAADANHVVLWNATNGAATIVRSFENDAGLDLGPLVSGGTSGNGTVYFALNQQSGDQVWSSDGTNVGTSLAVQLPASTTNPVASPAGSGVEDIAVLNGSVYFTTTDGGMMKADGQGGATPAPLPASLSDFGYLTAVGNRLYFTADDGVHGNEMWTTDGTLAGTVRLTDINPGSGSSFPIGPEQAGGVLYVIASDGIPTGPAQSVGEKLWMLPDTSAPAGAVVTTTVQASAPAVVTGGSVTLTATVAAANPGGPAPSGLVVFRDDQQVYGEATLVNGTASLAAQMSILGNHDLRAVYAGDTNFGESISAPVSVSVRESGTSLSLKSTAPTSILGQTVTLTAIISTPPGMSAPTGTVTFSDGQIVLGTAPVANNRAALLVAGLSLGSHPITASYAGDANYVGSSAGLMQTVTATTVATTINVATSATIATVGQQVALSAVVTPLAGTATPVGSVTFHDGNNVLAAVAIDPSGKALLLTSSLALGNHTITATFGGAGVFAGSTSTQVAVNIRLGAATTLSASSTAIASGQGVTLTTKVVATAGGAIQPSGTVTFYDGAMAIGSASVQNGVATLTTTSVATVGVHKVTAVYGGSALFGPAATGITYLTVRADATTTTFAPPAPPAPSTGVVTLTVSVGVVAPGSGSPTGSVTFLDGNTVLGTVTVSGGKAVLPLPKLAAGSHYLRATFAGTGVYGGSSSAVVHYTIAATTSTSLQAAAASFGQATQLKATVATLSPGVGKANGSVTFMDGATVLGTAGLVNGVATFNAKLGVGPHSFSAVYAGNASFLASTAATVNYQVTKAQPAVTLASSPGSPKAGGNVTLHVDVKPASPGAVGPSGSVTIMDGSTIVGTGLITGGSVIIHTTQLSKGSHSLTAIYAGDVDYLAASTGLTVTVD